MNFGIPMIDFVQKQTGDASAMLSVCTGSFILHAAGRLRGKRATTHRDSRNRLRAFPDVKVIQQRFVRNGTIVPIPA